MGDKTGIEWTDSSWNPLRGCSRVSEGCRNCYAEKVAHRFSGEGQPYEGLTTNKGRWNGEIMLVPEKLAEPLRWQKPRKVFVNSMSDLFHENVPFEYIAAVFGVMAAAQKHTFQVLTKRPKRALAFFEWVSSPDRAPKYFDRRGGSDPLAVLNHCLCIDPAASVLERWLDDEWGMEFPAQRWPLRNVWLGTSCENQKAADERIPLLLQCPAAVRLVSAEPLLGPIDFRYLEHGTEDHDLVDGFTGTGIPYTIRPGSHPNGLDWIIVGGESGPEARPCDVAWIRSIVSQCKDAGVACFVKQLGARPCYEYTQAGTLDGRPHDEVCIEPIELTDRKGGDISEWPEDLRVRQFPEVAP